MSTKYEFLQHFPDFTWDFTSEVLEKRSIYLLERIKVSLDDLTCLSEDKINFKSVCETFADLDVEIEREKSFLEVYFNASPVREIKEKCLKISKMWSDFFVELRMRRDIYDLLTKVKSVEKSLPYESARYLEKSLLYKRRDGLHLEANDREKFTALHKKLLNLCKDFCKNISDVDTSVEIEKQELLGMSEDFLKVLVQRDGKYIVTFKTPHIIPILKQCKVIKTRQIFEKAYNSRCIDKNVIILDEVLKLRSECANILGYPTHADFVTEMLMSKSAAKVHEFLTSLLEKIKNPLKKEMDRLLELKEKECREMGVSFDGIIHPYDYSYYKYMMEEQDYQINKNLIKEYFPFEHVTTQLFDIYQTVLGLKFEQVLDPPVIHPEVILYAVYDNATHSLMGYFYMDLFPRRFKYSRAACFGIQPACHFKNKPQLVCAVMMANFSKPMPGKPSLLTHKELRTYFHEFGHVMHQICSKTQFSMFQGTSVERDFAEAPSQMFENWCWEKESLKKISSHYQTREPMPDDLIIKIINSRRANISITFARQICLSMYYNANNLANTYEVLKECMVKYLGIEPTPGTNFAASFVHMCSGYDAQYYGYLWSQVYSYDMFLKFKKEGLLSSGPGLCFRKMIFSPGASKDSSEMLREYLGRDPILDPFSEILGTD